MWCCLENTTQKKQYKIGSGNMGYFFPNPSSGTGTNSGTGTRGNSADETSALAIPVTLTDVSAGNIINHTTFLDMVSVLEGMIDHTHTYTDDWTSNCNCNCTCQCTRGSL
jgi:hypothetical protein